MVAFSKVAAVVALAGSASAHTIFQQLWVNGVAQGQNKGIRVPSYNGPITDVTSNDIICNGGINPMGPKPNDVISVPSGSELIMEWHHDPTGPNPSDLSDPVDPTHKGPMLVYLAKVDNALTTPATGLRWFKIHEEGLDTSTSPVTWGMDTLYKLKGYYPFRLPTCIPPGQYLLRGELIALHGAGQYPGAQFYMSCAQINIVGGGSANPPTVSFPGAYAGSDPGISVNIYYPPLTTYTIPGPRPFTCGGTQPTTTPGTTRTTTTPAGPTTTSSRTTTTSSRTTTTTSRTTTTGGSGTGAALWAQCGGIGFSGPSTCAQGTCSVINPYYSQCTP